MRDLKLFELTPNNERKSFYGKAKVVEYTNDANKVKSELHSYSTKIAVFSHQDNEVIFLAKEEHLTNTTMNHLNAFLMFYRFNKMNKKEVLIKIT